MKLTIVSSCTKKAGKIVLGNGGFGFAVDAFDHYVVLEADVPLANDLLMKWMSISAIKEVKRETPQRVRIVVNGKFNLYDFFDIKDEAELPEALVARLSATTA